MWTFLSLILQLGLSRSYRLLCRLTAKPSVTVGKFTNISKVMSIKFTKLSKVLVIATIASLLSLEAKAEMKPLPEAFKDAYFTKGKDAFQQSTIIGQLNTIIGITGFPEQHISSDGQAVDEVYQAGLIKQSATGARMMTRDLENPYDTSLKENPSYSAF